VLKLPIFSFVCAIILFSLTTAISLAGQTLGSESKPGIIVKDYAQKSRGPGPDPHVKDRSVLNDPAMVPPPPPGKGGQMPGATMCSLTIDNHTPWKIEIFAEGQQIALVSPWGKISGMYPAGQMMLYGVAKFMNGPPLTWGPRTISSCEEPHIWELYERA
jgi:hypothetical protein